MSNARRPILSLLLCTAVLLSAGTGVANGMVLCLADDGCLAIEFPHAKHAGCHHGSAGDADDDADDDTIEPAATNHSCTDATLGAQTVERSAHHKVTPSAQLPLAAMLLPSISQLVNCKPSCLAATGDPPGRTASLRALSTIILLT